MSYPDIDKMFIEEINNHNNTISLAGDLQSILSLVTKFGFTTNTIIHDVLDCIQRKEYDKSAQIIKDAIYSIDTLATELVLISNSIKQGVFKVYEQED